MIPTNPHIIQHHSAENHRFPTKYNQVKLSIKKLSNVINWYRNFYHKTPNRDISPWRTGLSVVTKVGVLNRIEICVNEDDIMVSNFYKGLHSHTQSTIIST